MGDEVNARKTVHINDAQLANTIHTMLQASGLEVDMNVIKLIMRYQMNHFESIGAIKVVKKT